MLDSGDRFNLNIFSPSSLCKVAETSFSLYFFDQIDNQMDFL